VLQSFHFLLFTYHPPHEVSSFTLLFLLLAGLLWGWVQPVLAHAVPQFSNPAPNALIEEVPDNLTIEFNEPIVANLSRIDLLTQSGEAVPTGPLQLLDARRPYRCRLAA
jgi:methionine-rich copper-binding protein CopC